MEKDLSCWGWPDGDGPGYVVLMADHCSTLERQYRPRWAVGDRLWVRETVQADELYDDDVLGVRYLADDFFRPLPDTDEAKENHFRLRCYNSTDPDLDAYKKVPSIHMPRWASRITLDVTAVRVERLQDIAEADARAEGIIKYDDGWHWEPNPEPKYGRLIGDTARLAYGGLWETINGTGSWDANPWVAVIEFHRGAI